MPSDIVFYEVEQVNIVDDGDHTHASDIVFAWGGRQWRIVKPVLRGEHILPQRTSVQEGDGDWSVGISLSPDGRKLWREWVSIEQRGDLAVFMEGKVHWVSPVFSHAQIPKLFIPGYASEQDAHRVVAWLVSGRKIEADEKQLPVPTKLHGLFDHKEAMRDGVAYFDPAIQLYTGRTVLEWTLMFAMLATMLGVLALLIILMMTIRRLADQLHNTDRKVRRLTRFMHRQEANR